MDGEVVVVSGRDCCADATCLSSSSDLVCSSAGGVTYGNSKTATSEFSTNLRRITSQTDSPRTFPSLGITNGNNRRCAKRGEVLKLRCTVSLPHLGRSAPKELLVSFVCSSAFSFGYLLFSFQLRLSSLQLSVSVVFSINRSQ